MELAIGDRRVRLVAGDLTRVPADAIVNAANRALAGGGGVDGAIHRAGGPKIREDLDRIIAAQGGCEPGQAVVTRAGDLPARYVFHTVGPIYQKGGYRQEEILASCYRTCLQLADERGLRIVSFPAISTGAYGYPLAEAAEVAVRTVVTHLQASPGSVQVVVFVLFDDATRLAFEDALQRRKMRAAAPHDE